MLAPTASDVIVDCTFGGGGHAVALVEHLGEDGRYLGIDEDESALARAPSRLAADPRVRLVRGNFRDIDTHLAAADIGQPTKILLDLGLSSDQLTGTESARGFSFTTEEPLLMTLAQAPGEDALTARVVVNEWDEETLRLIIHGFGGEAQAKRIARAIVEARARRPIETSRELADIVLTVVKRHGPTHPATKTFQAVRMAVNNELGSLEDVLEKGIRALAPRGRIAVISFHSLEDGLVKRAMASWERKGWGIRLTKHPIVASRTEVLRNRRSRSAKLRCFEKAPQ